MAAGTTLDMIIAEADQQVAALKGDKYAILNLLMAILLEMDSIRTTNVFGQNYYRVTPRPLSATNPVLVVDKEPSGLVRKIDIVIDSPVGGTTPTIRLFNGSGVSINSGIPLNAGTINPIGEVDPGTQLFIASNVAIGAYAIERA